MMLRYGLLLFALLARNVEPEQLSAQITFEEIAEAAGIESSYGGGQFGGGASFYDFDNDGLDDITLATGFLKPLKFFHNTGGVFELLDPPPIENTDEINQILWADFDNDGDNDLFITAHFYRMRLYRNDGNLVFTDISAEAGLTMNSYQWEGAAWGDYNNDGWPDLYVTVYNDATEAQNNLLYRNNGNGTFSEVAVAAGAADTGKHPFQAVFTDFTNDGYQDVYLAQDRQDSNTVLANNQNGFTDLTQTSGGGFAMWAMSITPGDYDDDGDEDFYFSNLTNKKSKLAENLGNGDFQQSAEEAGVDWTSLGWGAVFLDADLDGDPDLYQAGGFASPEVHEISIFMKTTATVRLLLPRNRGLRMTQFPASPVLPET